VVTATIAVARLGFGLQFWGFSCGFRSWLRLRFWVIDSILGCGCGFEM
jgi:hypothetical protein